MEKEKEPETKFIVELTDTSALAAFSEQDFRICYSWQPLLEEPTNKEVYPQIRPSAE